jgi:hypothetical protein
MPYAFIVILQQGDTARMRRTMPDDVELVKSNLTPDAGLC